MLIMHYSDKQRQSIAMYLYISSKTLKSCSVAWRAIKNEQLYYVKYRLAYMEITFNVHSVYAAKKK